MAAHVPLTITSDDIVVLPAIELLVIESLVTELLVTESLVKELLVKESLVKELLVIDLPDRTSQGNQFTWPNKKKPNLFSL
jgi:hypothetical protein